MTGDASPSAMPDSSRHPFFCHLEEHVRYSELSVDAQDNSSSVSLLPQSRWSRTEVCGFYLLRSGSARIQRGGAVRKRHGLTHALPIYFQNGYEHLDSTEAFYRTFNPECHDETAVDQEVVDVILTGRVNTPFSIPPDCASHSSFSRPNLTFNLRGETVSFGVAYGSPTALSFSFSMWYVITSH